MTANVVLIVDPLAALRRYAADLITSMCTGTPELHFAIDGQAAIAAATEHSPSLIIIEISMAGLNGIETAALIWAAYPQARILFWTQHHRDIYMRDLKRITRDDSIYGYILKDAPEDKLVYAISSVWLHHNPYIDGAVRQAMVARPSGSKLNDREFEVLQDIALGLTEKAIARRRKLTIRGVQSRAASIYSKLLPEKQPEGTIDSTIDEMFSRRALLLCEAVRNGLIEPASLTVWKQDLDQWLAAEFNAATPQASSSLPRVMERS